MISESALKKKLQAYTSSQSGSKQISQTVTNAQQGKTILTNGQGQALLTDEQAEDMAKEFIAILKRWIKASAPAISAVADTLTYTVPRQTVGGKYEIIIKFDKEALHRESIIWHSGTTDYDGIDNIVALFNNGYGHDAPINHVLGLWKKPSGAKINNVLSVTERDPLYFMQLAEQEFELKYNSKLGAKHGIIVTLGSDYQ